MDLNINMPQFDTFDDEVSKESNELTVDASSLSPEGPFLSSVAHPDLSQGLSIVQGSEQMGSNLEPRRKGGWTKGKKRKKVTKDNNAPRQPLSGYLRFITERREKLRQEQPSLSFAEISKMLGSEWSTLDPLQKQKYLDDADKEKEKYLKDLEAYQKTETYKSFVSQIEKKPKDGTLPQEILSVQADVKEEEESGTFDIPIFTEEFLDHNKAREAELRQLRKQSMELEEQNAVLSKHTDNMKQAVHRLEVEAAESRENNAALAEHLQALRHKLTQAFLGLPLPGSGLVPSVDSVDTYMARLHSLILESPQENERLIAAVREIVGRLHPAQETSKVR